jgi:hypothetical protein
MSSVAVMNAQPSEPAPFAVGDLVKIRGAWHRGVHRLVEIAWRVPRPGGACGPYWRVMTEPYEPGPDCAMDTELFGGPATALDPA